MGFVGKVSKGSVFNQIYIPKNLRWEFEAGSLVEVKLLEKRLHYSRKFAISEFKEKLIKEIFSFLESFGVKQIIIAGSFLKEKIDYRDIDLLLVVDRRGEKFENVVYKKLIEKLNLKFHLLFFDEESFIKLQESCPLTRSMLYYSISNKKIEKRGRKIDENHIKFLLMMPEDLLKIKVNTRVFYDSLRRLVAIEKFLSSKEEDPSEINKDLKDELGVLYKEIRDNEIIEEAGIVRLRKIIQNKILKIRKMIKYGQEKSL